MDQDCRLVSPTLKVRAMWRPARSVPGSVRLALGLVGVAAVLLAGWSAWHRWRSPKKPHALNPLGFANVAPEVRYIGDQDCASCHQSISESYARTGMARSWRRPQEAEPIEDYSTPHEVIDQAGGYRYQVYREGDRFFQKEYRVDARGEVTHTHVREVAYVLGSGMKARSYVTDSHGYLTIMPVAWFSTERKWDLNPGYKLKNRRFSRPVTTQCMACHNSFPDYVARSEHRYRPPLPAGIGCERCHGPGELHLKYQMTKRVGSAASSMDRTIVNPARLPAQLQQDVCLQCHLSTKEGAILHAGREPFDYRPGQPLASLRANFQATGKLREQFTFISHGARAALSRCFTESDAKMTCVYCHDPHRPVREVPASWFNERCLSCHQPQACNRPQEPARELADAHRLNDCVRCHMPKLKPRDVDHTVSTDHWIRRRPGPGDGEASQTDPVTEPGPLDDFLHAANTGEQGIAHVNQGAKTGHPANLSQGLALLREATLREPDSARWHYWLGLAQRAQGQLREAASQMEQALSQLKDQPARALPEEELISLHNDLSQLYVELDQPERALKVLARQRAIMPDYLPAYINSAGINLAVGRGEAAVQNAQAGLERDPARAQLWWAIGTWLYEGERDAARALVRLERGIELDPSQPTIHVMLSDAYRSLGQIEQAEQALLKALDIDSESVPVLLALASLYIEHDRSADAVPRLEQVLRRTPNHAQARELLRRATRSGAPPH